MLSLRSTWGFNKISKKRLSYYSWSIQSMLVFLKAPSLALHFSYYTLMTLPFMISVTMLCMLIILLHLWQQLELACGLESDLRDTVDWRRKWFADFNAGKPQIVLFDRSYKTATVQHHDWGGARSCYFKMLDTLRIRISRAVGLSWTHNPSRNVASLNLLYRYYVEGCSSEMVEEVQLPCSHVMSSRLF